MDYQGDKEWQYLIIDLEKHCQLRNILDMKKKDSWLNCRDDILFYVYGFVYSSSNLTFNLI